MSNQTYNRRNCPTLRRNSKGDKVVKMQKRLTVHFKDINKVKFVDGIFGPFTEHKVRKFQKENNLFIDGVVGQNTWVSLLSNPQQKCFSSVGNTSTTADKQQTTNQNNNGLLSQRIIRALKRKGYKFYDDSKSYYMNIVGIRSPSTAINSFDDSMILLYRDDSRQMQAIEYPITTDPGEYFTKSKLLNKAGAAILVPGQYVDTYQVSKHRRKYDALCQRGGKVKIWRDGNRDDKLDRSGTIHEGWFGINIHRSGQSGTTSKIGRYSAGCQVFSKANDFTTFMSIVKKSKALRGNRFTYTLLEESDLK